jgi:hypothetical protein
MPYEPNPARYDTMAYRRCGRSSLKLPALSLGLWHNFGEDRPAALGRDLLRAASRCCGGFWRRPRASRRPLGGLLSMRAVGVRRRAILRRSTTLPLILRGWPKKGWVISRS